MSLKVIPDAVSAQTVRFLYPEDTAQAGASMMLEFDISAVVVLNEDRLVVLVTERYLAWDVVGADLKVSVTKLFDIMTEHPTTIAPDDSMLQALELMRLGKFRHLPIVADGAVVGMVSMCDFRLSIAKHTKGRLCPLVPGCAASLRVFDRALLEGW
jgi:CBS domain-containing protein